MTDMSAQLVNVREILPPLTPAGCDLRDFGFMPFDVRRLLSSETWVLGTPGERASSIALWLESWHQVPAASLPNNDRMLAHLSQSKDWAAEREHAMRGWVLCSDGRYYHPVVAEKALESWVEKLLTKIASTSGNATRWKVDLDVSDLKYACLDALYRLRELAPASRTFKKKAVATLLSKAKELASRGDPLGTENLSLGDQNKIEPDSPSDSLEDSAGDSSCDPDAIAIDRDRDREKDINTLSGCPDDFSLDGDQEPELPIEASDPVAEVIEHLNAKAGSKFRVVESSAKLIRARMREGATVDEMRAVIDSKAHEWAPGDPMRKYLRPATLFNAEKFAQYVGQMPTSPGSGSNASTLGSFVPNDWTAGAI